MREITEDLPKLEKYPVERPFWFMWVLVTTVGWALGISLTGELGVGLAVGLFQWLVLRPLLPEAGWWIANTTIGWGIGWAILLSGALIPPGSGFMGEVLTGVVLGAFVGLAQWLFLRKLVSQSVLWILISVVAWAGGLTGILGVLLVGSIVGAVSGLGLMWLLKNPLPDDEEFSTTETQRTQR